MRTALLAVAAVAAGGLVVPVTIAAADAADPAPARHIIYSDPAQADATTLSISGTLTPIHSETGPNRYALELPGGTLLPVSLARSGEIERPRSFTGDIAVPDAVADRAEARGATIDDGDAIAAASADGKDVVAAAATSTSPLPVASATMSSMQSERTAQGATASAHHLYLAVISNLGNQEADSTITSQTTAMRTYWTTESDGLITSFDQPKKIEYAATYATKANHCGLTDDTTAVWKEAAAKFAGVDFAAAGNHLMIVAPASCANGAVGIGTIGASLRSGGRTIVTLGNTGVAVGVHELGHNVSLEHANAEQCASSCSTHEYWDLYSIMGLAVSGGSWTPASLDTAYRVQTGIADAAEVPTLTSTTTVNLRGRGTTSGVRGALVTDPSSKARYAIDYRSGTGRDAKAFYAPGRSIGDYTYRPGVVVARIDSSDESTAIMTHKSGSTYITSYDEGETFSRGKVTVKVGAMTSDAVTVTVTLPGTAATPSPTSTSPSTSPATPLPTHAPTDAPTGAPTDPIPTGTGSPSRTPSETPSETPSATPTDTPTDSPSTFAPGTPRLVGSARVGRRVGVSPGSWSPRPQRFEYQWFADGRILRRATGSAITVPREVYGMRLSVRVTGVRQGYESASRLAASSAPVSAGRFSSRRVRITGHAVVGRVLAARTSDWRPSPAFSYRWYANGHKIGKATKRTLKVTRSMRGKRISVRITARQRGYTSATQSSPRTTSVR